jgi:hypothetical protein
MAHAYVNELNKIGAELNKTAANPFSRAKDLITGGQAKKLTETLGRLKSDRHNYAAMADTLGHSAGAKKENLTRSASGILAKAKDLRAEEGKVRGARAALAGTGLAAAGGAGYAAGRKKEASAIDDLAIERALQKVAESGLDLDEGAARIDAVLTLGVGESTKVASANSVEMAVDIRACEFLEAAGYPIEWNI